MSAHTIRVLTVSAYLARGTAPPFGSNHVHLLVEVSDKEALSRGMQGFQISAAKWLNKAIGKRQKRKRTGSVFAQQSPSLGRDSR